MTFKKIFFTTRSPSTCRSERTRPFLAMVGVVVSVLALTACSTVKTTGQAIQNNTQEWLSPTPACKASLDASLKSVPLQPVFDSMASELMVNVCGQGTLGGFVVTDLVNIADLKPGVAGLIMGEVARASLTRLDCQRVFQVEAANLLSLNDQGFIALSRKATEVRPEIGPVREAVVGTYHAWPDKMLVVLRRIDTNTGQLTRSVSREISFGCKAR
ncbi:MAG: FlgO protein [Pseudomonadota bacterium]|jgi:hypothetical protein